MACGACGSKSGASAGTTYKYVYKNARGETTTYDNQFEARARVLREGGTWDRVIVTPS